MAARNYLDELAKLRQSYGQRIADYPQAVEQTRSNIYGSDKVLPSLRSTRDDAIMALYDVDKRLADRYSNPQSETFIRDPYAREKLAAGQHQSVLGSVSGAERQVARREDLLGNLLDKSLSLLEMQLAGKQNEYNMLLNEAKLAAEGGSGSNLASLLALLTEGGQGEQTRTPTEDEQIRARRLAEARKGPVQTPAPEVGPLGTLLNPFVNLWNTATGSSAPPITRPNQNLSMNIDRASEEDIAQALQDITGIVPTSKTSPISGLGADSLALLQAVSGASPKLGEKLAEKYITQMLFPSESEAQTDITAPTNREALSAVLDKVAKFSTGTDDQGNALDSNYTALQFYNDIVALYPELDAESIRQLLATISPSFATINY